MDDFCQCAILIEADAECSFPRVCPKCKKQVNAQGPMIEKDDENEAATNSGWDYSESQEEGKAPQHDGKKNEMDHSFFVNPPIEIGKILSMKTSLKAGIEPRPLVVRIALAVFVLAFTAVAGAVLYIFLGGYDSVPWVISGGGVLLGFVAAAYLLFDHNFYHICTYIGVDGFAVYECTGHRSNLVTRKVVLFQDVKVMHCCVVETINVGKTSYIFLWKGPANKVLAEFEGTFKNEDEKRHVHADYIEFGRAAENAWTHYQYVTERDRYSDGFLSFSWGEQDVILINAEEIKFVKGGKSTVFTKDQIQEVNLENAKVTICFKGSKQSFDYGQLGNARFFLYHLNKLCPIQERTSWFRLPWN